MALSYAQKTKFSMLHSLFVVTKWAFIGKKLYLCTTNNNDMVNTGNDSANIKMAESIESKYRVNHVDSHLPRWLIEAAFVCYILSAVFNYSPLLHWIEQHASWLNAFLGTFGSLVMYIALLRGMKPLYRPMTVAWWIVIVQDILGFFALLFPSLAGVYGLPVAVSLMLVYLPFGCTIAYCYRGRLRQVGIWMALYILISSIVPVLTYLLFPPDSWIGTLSLEIPTIAVIIIYAWVQRRVLVTDGTAEG